MFRTMNRHDLFDFTDFFERNLISDPNVARKSKNQAVTAGASSAPARFDCDEKSIRIRVKLAGVDPATVKVTSRDSNITVTYEESGATCRSQYNIADESYDVSKLTATHQFGELTLEAPVFSTKEPKERPVPLTVK